MARADLLAPLVQEAHVACHGSLGPIRQNLLSLLALGPASFFHRLQNRAALLGGAWRAGAGLSGKGAETEWVGLDDGQA